MFDGDCGPCIILPWQCRTMDEDVGPSEASKFPAFLHPSLNRVATAAVLVAAIAAVGATLYMARHTVVGSSVNAKLYALYSGALKVISMSRHLLSRRSHQCLAAHAGSASEACLSKWHH